MLYPNPNSNSNSMPSKCVNTRAGDDIPHLDHLVAAARNEEGGARSSREALDAVLMSAGEGVGELAGGEVEDDYVTGDAARS